MTRKITDTMAETFRPMLERASVAAQPVLLIRAGRGKSGGSFVLNHAIQRARFQGRKVRPLDADKRSETLITAYGPPAGVEQQGPADPQWATAPSSEEPADVRDWLMGELDAMAEDGMARVVDFNGGDRMVSDIQRDLDLPPFCEAIGVRCRWMISLGPETEDFRHMVRAASAGHVKPHETLLVLNEGVIAHGQTTSNAFSPVLLNPDFQALVRDGIRFVLMRRLPCVPRLRETGLGIYEAAYPAATSPRPSATVQHMARQWVDDYEAKLVAEQATDCLP